MKFAIKLLLITTILLSFELGQLCHGCSMSHMRSRALRACDDFASRIRHRSMEDPTVEYHIITVPANRTDRSVGHHRRLAKIITKDDYPENGYLVVYHPYTKYFRSAKEQHRYNSYKSHHKQHHHFHSKHENEVLQEKAAGHEVRPKRYIDDDPAVAYCCSNPSDLEVCHELICTFFK